MESHKRSGTFITNSALKPPMGNLIEEYVSLTAGLSRSTIAQHRSHADNWLLPHWTSWPVGRVTQARDRGMDRGYDRSRSRCIHRSEGASTPH